LPPPPGGTLEALGTVQLESRWKWEVFRCLNVFDVFPRRDFARAKSLLKKVKTSKPQSEPRTSPKQPGGSRYFPEHPRAPRKPSKRSPGHLGVFRFFNVFDVFQEGLCPAKSLLKNVKTSKPQSEPRTLPQQPGGSRCFPEHPRAPRKPSKRSSGYLGVFRFFNVFDVFQEGLCLQKSPDPDEILSPSEKKKS
jgi:hypothetical protein